MADTLIILKHKHRGELVNYGQHPEFSCSAPNNSKICPLNYVLCFLKTFDIVNSTLTGL